MMRTRIDELHDLAANTTPAEVWHYVNRGAGDGITVGEAQAAWAAWRLRPRILRDVSAIDSRADLFGAWRTPIGVAPTAFHKLLDPDGEVATANACSAAGAALVLSSRSTTRIEDAARAVGGPWWFQVYVMQDRDITAALAERAAAAGARALVLTGDTPYLGYRPRAGGARPLDIDQRDALVNVGQHCEPGASIDAIWSAIEQRADQTLDTVDWLKRLSGLPVIVKGVLRGDEALAAVDAGADAIWVSNHGGRQLDRAIPAAFALPEVVGALGQVSAGPVPVIVDGGVRSGLDALIGLALGACMVFVGRPVMWGLAAGGRSGVHEVLEELSDGLCHAMGLAGAARLSDLDPSLVTRPPTIPSPDR